MSREYANPDALVSTEWVQEHLDDPNVRIVESNEDLLLYSSGHIPGAVHIDWVNDLQDRTTRDYIAPEQFKALCEKNGIAADTHVVFYGDKSNWWACYAFWVFALFGHRKLSVVNGGRDKWKSLGLPMTRDVPSVPRTTYELQPARPEIRAFRSDVFDHLEAGGPLLDVRSPDEFSGKLTHMPNYPQEGALRGGHIPGAVNVPWARAADDDGCFRDRESLETIYLREKGLTPDDDVVAYCRIGERSSHTWFVLTHLLGFRRVRNYDGSWTEWGNLVGAPIEKSV